MNECSNGRLVSFLIEGDDVVSCEVCLEPFQPLNRPPKILPCGHNFCDQCLFSLCCHQQYYLLDSIKCPTCRTSFPTEVAIDAPTNWDLCKILENVQKGREMNVTVIHVPDMPARVLPEASFQSSKRKGVLARTASRIQKEKCGDCARKLSAKLIGRASRFCQECNQKDKITFTCLECCVNKHNGHTLLSLSQLQAEQLKVLGELRELRKRVVDALSSAQSFPGGFSGEGHKDLCTSTAATNQTTESTDGRLAQLDTAIELVESSAVIAPTKLNELRNEQIQQCSRLFKMTHEPVRQDTSVLKKSEGSSYSKQARSLSRSTTFHSFSSLEFLIPLLPCTTLTKELSNLIQDVSPKQPVELRCEAFMKAASLLTTILYDDISIEQLPLIADALLQCFCQANSLSRKKPQLTKSPTISRKAIWKSVQMSYTELMRHISKNFLSYEPERIAILDDLAYLCSLYADVCDQATVTICMIEAARARMSDEKLPEPMRQKTAQRLKEIDDHLLECRRLQKLQDLRTTKTKKAKKLRWLWRFFRQRSKKHACA
ncbi:RING-type domain-containing protein [Trichostrongylus colubriformis]|uniref:RING-type domain-containing protein n=1 Tax=Trichostrongylus colubriformis TaxID=6319 RepID=A0AAN8IVC5_TRICO